MLSKSTIPGIFILFFSVLGMYFQIDLITGLDRVYPELSPADAERIAHDSSINLYLNLAIILAAIGCIFSKTESKDD